MSLIPEDVMAECRALAAEAEQRPRSPRAAIAIVATWIVAAVMLGWAAMARWGRPG